MKILLPTWILVFACLGFSQPTKAELVDEFSNPNCEDLSARLDALAVNLSNQPRAKAYITVTGKINELRNNLFKEGMIRTYFPRRKFRSEQWQVIRTGLGDQFRVRFWIVASGASLPDVNANDWSYVLSSGEKAYIFDRGESYAEDVCPFVNGFDLLSDVLKANPKAKTHVVLVVRSQKEFNRRSGEILRTLTQDYAISRSKIRIFKKMRRKADTHGIDSDAEYWVVP